MCRFNQNLYKNSVNFLSFFLSPCFELITLEVSDHGFDKQTLYNYKGWINQPETSFPLELNEGLIVEQLPARSQVGLQVLQWTKRLKGIVIVGHFDRK